jgi:rfaE bifunctional protein kinase chain/domain
VPSRAAKKAKLSAQAVSPSSVDISRLLDIVGAFLRQTICVIGDFVLDEFVSGEISRVSREAPVLILRHRHTEAYPGGAANAVNNLADLGARVLPVGVVGENEGAQTLLDYFQRKGISTRDIVRVKNYVTTTKTRYLAGWSHKTEQQVLRVDKESAVILPPSVRSTIEEKVLAAARLADAVLISDYGLGTATPELARKLKTKRVTLDSRYRILDYRDCGISAATPNEDEVEMAYHQAIGSDIAKLETSGKRMLEEMGLEALVITRGKDGMAVFEKSSASKAEATLPPQHIPIYGSDVPVDVTGAGDTVIAVFTLALAAGASYFEAAHLANYAGGIVVAKPRTASLTRVELEAALRGAVTASH